MDYQGGAIIAIVATVLTPLGVGLWKVGRRIGTWAYGLGEKIVARHFEFLGAMEQATQENQAILKGLLEHQNGILSELTKNDRAHQEILAILSREIFPERP
jgi:hypothetical protein